jgi:hypothetical protein
MLLPEAGFVNDFRYYFLQDALAAPKKLLRCGISRNMQDFRTYSWTG